MSLHQHQYQQANTTSQPQSQPQSPQILPATARISEISQHKSELEVARRENEGLKMRIRELEALLKEKEKEKEEGEERVGGGSMVEKLEQGVLGKDKD